MPPALLLDEQPVDPTDVPHNATCTGCRECSPTAPLPRQRPGRPSLVRVPTFARTLAEHVTRTSREHLERGREALRRLDDLVLAAAAVRHRVVMA